MGDLCIFCSILYEFKTLKNKVYEEKKTKSSSTNSTFDDINMSNLYTLGIINEVKRQATDRENIYSTFEK